MRKLLLGITLLVISISVHAEYVNNESVVGLYSESATWDSGNTTPPANGNLTQTLTVRGDVNKATGGLTTKTVNVYGSLTVAGDVVVDAGTYKQGWRTKYYDGLTVYSGAIVEIYGNLDVNSPTVVEEGGTLIVHGNFDIASLVSMNVEGNVIIIGDYNDGIFSSVTVSGNLVVGGEMDGDDIYLTWGNEGTVYVLDPEAEVSWWTTSMVGENLDDLEDLLASGNEGLINIVEESGYGGVGSCYYSSGSGSWSDSNTWYYGSASSTTNSSGVCPQDDSKIIIKGGHTVTLSSSDVICNKLALKSQSSLVVDGVLLTVEDELYLNGSLVIESTGQVTVNGETTVDVVDGIVINGGTTGVGSFITTGTVENNANSKLNYTFGANRYYYSCVPVQGITSGDYGFDDATNTRCQVFNKASKEYFFVTNGTTQLSSTVSNSSLATMEGYAVAYRNETEVSFSGAFFTGDQSVDLVEGWNLVCNPYPSSINVESSGFTKGDIASTIWCKTTLGSGDRAWSTYNSAAGQSVNGGSAIISPMQAFFVNANSATTLSVSNEARTHGVGILKAASNQIPNNVIRMQLENGDKIDESLIYFSDNSTNGIDEGDSEKRFETSATALPQLYTVNSNKNLVINGMETLAFSSSIPIGYTLGTAASLNLKFTTVNQFNEDYDVYLVDNYSGDMQDLRVDDTYEFESDAVAGEERFELYISQRVATTSIGEVMYGGDVKIMSHDNNVVVRVGESCLQKDNVKVVIWNVSGEVVSSEEVTSSYQEVTILGGSGCYVVSVQTGDHVYTQKVYIQGK